MPELIWHLLPSHDLISPLFLCVHCAVCASSTKLIYPQASTVKINDDPANKWCVAAHKAIRSTWIIYGILYTIDGPNYIRCSSRITHPIQDLLVTSHGHNHWTEFSSQQNLNCNWPVSPPTSHLTWPDLTWPRSLRPAAAAGSHRWLGCQLPRAAAVTVTTTAAASPPPLVHCLCVVIEPLILASTPAETGRRYKHSQTHKRRPGGQCRPESGVGRCERTAAVWRTVQYSTDPATTKELWCR